ncbi:acyl-CoA desaturase [Pectobacterium parmentieri]|uniref:Acyl-CoA desaturase n=2 Tax=Pectobacterium parmentieri TaxID=1905730 RepID=A0A0H3I9I0_PECPM|nr:acyl-CoA desaturase [Pectobacterium parmentieri]AFI92643.1 Linoleoyl-CoA desaturase [Pectobacterium parmentieri]AYH07828.1 acyl-CoA desaturase [Pectobacterium parmentieri]AYH16580.1 acyl-CoA desaturase [Pectobacterium parmentieri]AYH25279.1 acyl-CoA desaturase [Pectobacterium parmentieri]MBI0556141.1 acyl-CoA desaturase [Pectobacterium parmentieri]
MTSVLPAKPYPAKGEQAFHRALQRETSAYLRANHDHRFADRGQFIKAGLLFLGCIVCYALSLMQQTAWAFFLSYFSFIMLSMVLNIIVNHDASHNTFFRNRTLNRVVGRIVTLPLGIDPDYWRLRHVDFHHLYPNVEHYDLDTEENGIFRQTPFQRHRSYMRYQHLYWPLVAAFSLPYIAWIFDWADRLGNTPVNAHSAQSGRGGWLIFIASKVGHLLLLLVIPIMVGAAHGISPGIVLLSYLLGQMLASLLVVFLLLGTHWAEAEFYAVADAEAMPQGWYQHNFATACDWLPTPRWLEHWTGGLHLHLTHHLFPGWHHRHYPALAAILRRVAAEHGMNYRCITYRELLSSQRRFLKSMGEGNDRRTAPHTAEHQSEEE